MRGFRPGSRFPFTFASTAACGRTHVPWTGKDCAISARTTVSPGVEDVPRAEQLFQSNYEGELTTGFKSRASGDRVKYRIDGNSLKGYGKASTPVGDLFRVETLTQNVEVFKIYRLNQGGPADGLKWRRMRRGVADLHSRTEVSQKANERYRDALGALHPFQADDHPLLQAVNRGEFTLNGFRNRDLQVLLYGPVNPKAALTTAEKRSRSAAVSRKAENSPHSRTDR